MPDLQVETDVPVTAGTVHVEFVDVTPDKASGWLHFNTNNRILSKATVNAWAEEMRSGKWRFNGEPIQFDREGRLINGQHRLHAIVASGATIRCLVVYGLEPSAQMTIDIGRTRAAGQQLSLLGIGSGTDMAALATALIRLDKSDDQVWASSNQPAKATVIDFCVLNHELMLRALNYGHAAYKALGVPRVTHAAVAARAISAGHQDDWDWFHGGFISGANLPLGDPRIELRNRIVKLIRGGGNQWLQQQRVAITIKAFNAYLEGRSVKLLRFNRDELPMPQIV